MRVRAAFQITTQTMKFDARRFAILLRNVLFGAVLQ